MYQTLKGLSVIHNSNIIHRDIRLNNILIRFELNFMKVAIADFGLSRKDCKEKSSLLSISCSPFIAPEGLVSLDADYGKGVDVWSLAVCFGLLISRKNSQLFPPPSNSSPFAQLSSIFSVVGGPPSSFFPQSSKNQFSQLVNMPASKTLEEIVPSASKQELHLICKMLQALPSKRITALQALNHPLFEAHSQEEQSNQIELFIDEETFTEDEKKLREALQEVI